MKDVPQLEAEFSAAISRIEKALRDSKDKEEEAAHAKTLASMKEFLTTDESAVKKNEDSVNMWKKLNSGDSGESASTPASAKSTGKIAFRPKKKEAVSSSTTTPKESQAEASSATTQADDSTTTTSASGKVTFKKRK
jgi:cytoskeletal protein RodZ